MTFVDAIKSTMSLGILVGGVLPSWTHFMFPYTKRGIGETESYMRELISYRLKNLNENRHDLLSLLVSSNAEQIAEKSLTEQELIADVFIFLLAGHETSATTLNWMLYELCLQPEIQEKMYEEVTRVLGDEENPNMEKYYELTYTRNAVQETLRKHPPISFIPKLNKVKTKIGDYVLPANTEVYLSSYQAQHDERYWKNPQVYMPERFDPSNENYMKQPSGAWIPFSIGQRKCIGNRFSEIETAMIMARLVKKYRFELPKDDPKMQAKAWLSGHPPTEEILTLRPSGMLVELLARK
jgi:cytochrome P450 family 3 subfamily A